MRATSAGLLALVGVGVVLVALAPGCALVLEDVYVPPIDGGIESGAPPAAPGSSGTPGAPEAGASTGAEAGGGGDGGGGDGGGVPPSSGVGNGTGTGSAEADAVVNTYTAVDKAADENSKKLHVTSVSKIAKGKVVLVWQVTTDDVAAGASLTLAASLGRYDFFRVTDTDDGDKEISLDRPLGFAVEAAGAQIVTVPEYGDLTIKATSTVRADPWNGATGGIIALLASGTLTVDGAIDVNGAGFRGGPSDDKATMNGCPTVADGTPAMGYAPRGEGLARKRFAATQSTSATSNGPASYGGGGGGGACHNGGGAGGGHGGAGGRGGDTYVGGVLTAGRFADGGARLDYDARARFAFGGGGGEGERNDGGNTVLPGGNGGGVIVVRAKTVTGAGTIRARGGDGNQNLGDGSSGGGAGGLVVLDATENVACFAVDVGGGKGGDTDGCGPGGGGGPGRIAIAHLAGGTCAKLVGAPGGGGTSTGIPSGPRGAAAGESKAPFVMLTPR